jgi:hypothetical protein
MSRLAEIGCAIVFVVIVVVLGWGVIALVRSL